MTSRTEVMLTTIELQHNTRASGNSGLCNSVTVQLESQATIHHATQKAEIEKFPTPTKKGLPNSSLATMFNDAVMGVPGGVANVAENRANASPVLIV